MKKKLKLDQLKVQSFVTALNTEESVLAKGGDNVLDYAALSNTLCICLTRGNGCITYLSTCIPPVKPTGATG